MTREALLPCPFCGSPAELEHDGDHHGEWFNLGCSRHWGRVDPQCPAGRIWYTEVPSAEAEAIAAWNTRTRPDGGLAALMETLQVKAKKWRTEADHVGADRWRVAYNNALKYCAAELEALAKEGGR